MHLERVREIVSQHGRLHVPVTNIGNDSDLREAGLTSLATVGLMLALEDAFEIEFPNSLLSRRTFGSISAIAAAVADLSGSQLAAAECGR